MSDDHGVSALRDEFAATFVELAVRLAALAALIYFAFVFIQPFSSIIVWSAIVTVALYPAFDWLARRLWGHRRLAALLMTILTLLIVIAPAGWLVRNMIQTFQELSTQFDWSSISLPPPTESVKGWPLIGNWVYQFWNNASADLSYALEPIVPQLKPMGATLLRSAAETGTETIKFFVAVIVAGFLLPLGPSLARGMKNFSRHLATRGEEFVNLAGATIRAVSLGVIGISVVQAVLVGVVLNVAGVGRAGLLSSAVLICGIVQIGPWIVLIPLIIWSWLVMDINIALAITAAMVAVILFGIFLQPVVMGRGLQTPMAVTFVGVIGGALAYGISGLFLGPIVLAVCWELLAAWTRDPQAAVTASAEPVLPHGPVNP
jgi:predicted PurR-regulated permease PerM